jgi:hypothetical protein
MVQYPALRNLFCTVQELDGVVGSLELIWTASKGFSSKSACMGARFSHGMNQFGNVKLSSNSNSLLVKWCGTDVGSAIINFTMA